MKKKFAAVIAAMVVFAMSACSAENTVSDDTVANTDSSSTSAIEETTAVEEESIAGQEEKDNVYEMAKTIHIATATYLTMKGIDGEEIPEDFDLNEMKYVFQ